MNAALTGLIALPALLVVCLLLALASAGGAAGPLPALPEGNAAIAAHYPGDVGIEKDAAVIFHDDFEGYRTTVDLSKKWDARWGEAHISIAEDPANVNSGRRAVEMTIPKQDRGVPKLIRGGLRQV